MDRAGTGGSQLTGEGGLRQQLTKRLLESGLDGEITDHLGYDKHDPAGCGTGNRAKTVLTDVGPVEISVPRDRDGSCDHRGLAPDGHPDLRRALAAQQFPLRGPAAWGRSRRVCTAPTEAAARERFAEFVQEWGARYPAIVRLWDNAWAEFVPFLAFDPEIWRVICSTNAIESVNAEGSWALPPPCRPR